MKKWLLSILLMLCLSSSRAYDIVELKLPNYLHNEAVHACIEDENGFIYFITSGNIYRFDGFRFTPLFTAKQVDIDQAQLIDQQWFISTTAGDLYHYATDELIPIGELGFKASSFLSFENKIYIGTRGGGCFVYEADTLYQLSGLSDNYIYDIQSKQQDIFLATDNGINRISQNQISHYGIEEGLSDYIVTKLYPGDDGIYFRTFDGTISQFDASTERVVQVEHLAPNTSFLHYLGRNNYFYITPSNTLYIREHEFQDSIALNFHVAACLLTKDNILYLTDSEGGIYKVNLNINFVQTTVDYVECLFVDSKAQIWLSTDNGIYIHQALNSPPINHLPIAKNTPVTSFIESPAEVIYVGTMGNGLYSFSLDGQLLKRYTEEDGLLNNHILHLERYDNKLWMATLAGITALNMQSGRFEQLQSEYIDQSNQYFYSVLPLDDKRLLIGSDGDGLLVHKNGVTKRVSLGAASNQTVLCLEKDDAYIWTAVQGEGVYYFNSTDTLLLDESKGLRNLNVHAIYTNGQVVIFAHEDGIDFYTVEDQQFSYYTFERSKKLNLQHVYERYPKILLSYEDGLLATDITYAQNPLRPRVHLHPLLLFYEATAATEFTYKQNHISFEFGALHAENPEAVFFKYRLQGFDDDWQLTQQLEVTYNKLPPGKYQFEVACGLHENFEPLQTASLAFEIRKPFWLQWWFVILSILAFAALLAGLFKIQMIQLKKKQLAQQQKMQYEFENLRNQINPHFLFNSFNSLIGVTEEDPEKAVAYLEKLSIFFRNILTVEKYETISLREELAIAENYFTIQQLRYEDMIQLHIDIPEEVMDYRIVPMVLQLLIENAVKHNHISRDASLHIWISLEHDYLCVKNNINKKIHASEKSTYLGLNIIRRRYQLLSERKIEITQKQDEFIVKLPLIQRG